MTNYLSLFQSLNVNKSGNSLAPHKPILLLSIMDLIESGSINSHFIPLSDLLISQFKRNWRIYVQNSTKFNCGMQYPFYHLSSSHFWHLVKTPDSKAKAPGSMKSLRRDFIGANLDQALFELMKDPQTRQELRSVLISTFLSDSPSIAAEPLLSAFALLGIVDWQLFSII